MVGLVTWITAARWRVTGLASVFIAFCALISYLWAHWHVGPHVQQFDLQIYFRAVHYWADGGSIYDYAQYDRVQISLGFTYPPLAAVLMYPMAAVSWPIVKTVTLLAIVAAAAACTFLSLRERFDLRVRPMLFVTALATCAAFDLEPIRETLAFGQINLFLATLVMADLLVLGRRQSKWTGLGIGLAMAIKLTPGIFLLYLILARQWRAVVVALGTAIGASLVAAVVAPTETWQFFTTLLWQSDRVGYLGNAANQSVNGLLSRFAYPGQASHLVWIVAVLVLGALAVRRIRFALHRGDQLAAITICGLTGVLISPVSWPHHLVWVLPAAIMLLARLFTAVEFSLVAPPVRGWKAVSRLRPLAGPIVLALSGVLALGFDARSVFKLPDVDFSQASPFAVMAASLPMFWVLAALLLLPIGERRRGPIPIPVQPR